MIIEMLFIYKIEIFFFWNELNFFKSELYNFVHYWKNFMNQFLFFSFGQIINKIS
jgi:hypothetical protein